MIVEVREIERKWGCQWGIREGDAGGWGGKKEGEWDEKLWDGELGRGNRWIVNK